MNAQTIATLLRITQSEKSEFKLSKGLEVIHREYQLGHLIGVSRIRFSARDKQEIAMMLAGLHGIDASSTDPQAWKDVTRAQAMSLGNNEKLARTPVKRNRISIKALPGRALQIDGLTIELPDGAHLDIDWTTLGDIGHDSVLLVENYEVFDQLHRTQVSEALAQAGLAGCLVIYRGDPNESRLDNVKAFLRDARLPVVFFGDLDPASLVEMARTQWVTRFVVPTSLADVLVKHGNRALYNQQAGAEFDALLESACDSVRDVCKMIQKARRGLAQEALISEAVSLDVMTSVATDQPRAPLRPQGASNS